MNNKAEVGMGMLLTVFVGIVVSLVLLQAAAVFQGQAVNTVSLVNKTYTAPAVNSTIDLMGQELLTTPIVTNASGNATTGVITTGNYTIAEGVSSTDGLKRIRYTTKDTSTFASKSVNISYDYGAEGYIDDAGGRTMATLIILLAALAIAVFALVPTLRNGVIDLISR